MDLKDNKKYKLSAGEIVGKKRKKKVNYFKYSFNVIVFIILAILVFFAAYRFWVYRSISKYTPVENVSNYIIFDSQALTHSKYWQNILFDYLYIEDNRFDKEILNTLLENNKYYFSVYNDNKTKLLFYIPNLDSNFQEKLKSKNLSFIYDNNFLLLNANKFDNRKNTDIFHLIDFNIMNRIAIGEYNKEYFVLSENNKTLNIDLTKHISKGKNYKTYLSYNKFKDKDLYILSNFLLWQDIKEFIDLDKYLTLSDDQHFEFIIYNEEHKLLTKNFTAIFKNLDNSQEILKQLQYLIAYNNRQTRDIELKDGSITKEVYLDFEEFKWQDNGSYKQIRLDDNDELFLYSKIVDNNLLLTTVLSDVNIFENFVPSNFYKYYYIDKSLLNKFNNDLYNLFPCGKILFKNDSFLQIKNCE